MDLSVTPGLTGSTTAVSSPPAGISLILPAYNEEQVIRRAIREAVSALARLGRPYEVIVVNDGSTDATDLAAWDESLRHSNVRVVSLPENVGYAGALQQGFKAARCELVVFTDADCQFDLNDLEKLLTLSRTADVVCGYRADRHDSWMRKLYSGGFNLLVRGLLGIGVRDCDCALKIFRRDWINSIELVEQGFFFNAEVLTRARQNGLQIAEAPVAHRARQAGTSKVSIVHIAPILATLLRFWWSQVAFPAGRRVVRSQGGVGWRTSVCAVGLALLSGLMLLPRLSHPLLDPDEGRYAQIALEMLDSGDLVVPTRLGKPYLDKPPLLYWLTALSYWTSGVNEQSARQVMALTACATVLCTFCLGTVLVGRRAAAIGAVLLLTSVGFLISGRFLSMDMLLTCFTTVALLAGYGACRGESRRPVLWLVSAIACGCGILTKGPIVPLLCVPPLAVSCWLTRCPMRPRMRDWLLYGLTTVAVAGPWFMAIDGRQNGFLYDFIWTHHVQRFAGHLTHENPWWYYIPIVLIGALPCSILFPATGVFLATRDARARSSRTWELGFLLLAAGWIFGLFSLSQCKLPAYVLPLLPLVCLVVGVALNSIVADSNAHGFLAYVRDYSPRDLTLILVLGAVAAAILDLRWLDGFSSGRLELWAVVIMVGATLGGALSGRFQTTSPVKWGLVGVYTLLCMSYGLGAVYTDVARLRSTIAPIDAFCRTLEQPPLRVVGYSLGQAEDSLTFHFRGRLMQNFDQHETRGVMTALRCEPPTLLLANTAHLAQLLKNTPPQIEIVELGRYLNVVAAVPRKKPADAAAARQESVATASRVPTTVTP